MIAGRASSNFNDEYATLIKRGEGFSPAAYFNQGDVPSIGYGFAFVTVSNGVYTERSAASLNGFFAGIHTFSAADESTLHDIAADLTNGDYAAAHAKFNSWPFASGVTLTDVEATTVLINVATDIAQGSIPQDVRAGLADTRELAVLYSLAYNGPSYVAATSRLIGAIRNDNRAEAWYEIRYNSQVNDPTYQDGIAKRRYAESQILALEDTPGQPTEDEARQVFRMFTHHEADIRQYDTQFGAQISSANQDYQLANTPDEVQTRLEAFQPSFDLLVTGYASGVSIDEIFIDFIPDAALHPTDPPRNLIDRTGQPQANDLIFGETGDDKILAEAGNDVIYGDFGSSALDANYGAGNDTIYGGAGNDTIDGGFGYDELRGGPGDDVFALASGGFDESIDGGISVWADTIMDAETGDRAVFGDITLTGGTLDGYYFQPDEFEGGEWVPIESDEGYAYYNEEDHIYYSKQDGDLLIMLFDQNDNFVENVLVEDWSDGELGIHLTLVDNRPGGGGGSPLLFEGGQEMAGVEAAAGQPKTVLDVPDIVHGLTAENRFSFYAEAEKPSASDAAVAAAALPASENFISALADQIASIAA